MTIFSDRHHFSRTLGDVWWQSFQTDIASVELWAMFDDKLWRQPWLRYKFGRCLKTPQKHHHKNTTRPPPQKHHHKNTTTNVWWQSFTTSITSVELWAMFENTTTKHHQKTSPQKHHHKTPPQKHNHKNTSTPPQKHNHNTTTKTPPKKTPPKHHHKTPPQKHHHKTPPQKHNHKNTTTPPHHHKNTTKTQPHHHHHHHRHHHHHHHHHKNTSFQRPAHTKWRKDRSAMSKMPILPQFWASDAHEMTRGLPPADAECPFYHSFEHPTRPKWRKGCSARSRICILPQFWTSDTCKVTKGSLGDVKNLRFTTVLNVRHVRSDERVDPRAQKFAFYHSFERPTRPKWRKGRSASSEICILPQFWASDTHEVTRGLSNPQVRSLRPRQKKNIF